MTYTQQGMSRRSRKNMILMSSGLLVSLLGTQVFNFAVGLYVLNLTGSGLDFAVTLVVGAVPRLLLAPFMGVMADRMDRKNLMYTADFICGLIVLNMLLVASHKAISVQLIYMTTFGLGIFNTLFDISATSLKASLVEEHELMKINALDQGIMSVSMILGPLLGGLIYTFIDFKAFVLMNGCSFIVSSLTECFLEPRTDQTSEMKEKEESVFGDLKEGYRYLMNHPSFKRILGISIVVNFFIHFAVIVPLPYVLNVLFQVSSKAYGFVNGAFPVGVLLGTLMLFRMKDETRVYPWLPLAVLTYGTLMCLMSVPFLNTGLVWSKNAVTLYFAGLMLIFGLNIAILDIPFMAFAQRTVDPSVRGRVFSTFLSLSKLISPLGLILSGIAMEWVEPAWICFGGGVLTILLLIKLGVLNLGQLFNTALPEVPEST